MIQFKLPNAVLWPIDVFCWKVSRREHWMLTVWMREAVRAASIRALLIRMPFDLIEPSQAPKQLLKGGIACGQKQKYRLEYV